MRNTRPFARLATTTLVLGSIALAACGAPTVATVPATQTSAPATPTTAPTTAPTSLPPTVAATAAPTVLSPTVAATTTPASTMEPATTATAPSAASPVEFVRKLDTAALGIKQPQGLAVDGQANLYIADAANHRIVKVDRAGKLVTTWGSRGAGDGQFNLVGPDDPGQTGGWIALDKQGNLYVADTFNKRVQKFDSNGKFLLKWDTPTDGIVAAWVTLDGQDHVYVQTQGAGTQELDTNLKPLAHWGQGSPIAVEGIDHEGHLLAANFDNGHIEKLDANGKVLAEWGGQGTGDGQFDHPTGVVVDSHGNLYVVDVGGGRIQTFDANGKYIGQWRDPGNGDGPFKSPIGLAIDTQDNIYLSDVDGDNVYVFRPRSAAASGASTSTMEPAITTTAQNAASPLEVVRTIDISAHPMGNVTSMSVDSQGNLFLGDAYTQRILKFDKDGKFLLEWGGPGTGDGQFMLRPEVVTKPEGGRGPHAAQIALDSQGHVYVADFFNNRVQKFDNNGKFLLKWGNPGTGDGQFQTTNGVGIDQQDNVFVGDGNGRIQQFDVNGKFVSKWGSQGQGDGQFIVPLDLAFDSEGNSYVVDPAANRVQKFDRQRKYLLAWGSEGTSDGHFVNDDNVVVDQQNRVYVSDDVGTARVQQFDANGRLLGVWHAPMIPNHVAAFCSLATDNAGNIYCADHSEDGPGTAPPYGNTIYVLRPR